MAVVPLDSVANRNKIYGLCIQKNLYSVRHNDDNVIAIQFILLYTRRRYILFVFIKTYWKPIRFHLINYTRSTQSSYLLLFLSPMLTSYQFQCFPKCTLETNFAIKYNLFRGDDGGKSIRLV